MRILIASFLLSACSTLNVYGEDDILKVKEDPDPAIQEVVESFIHDCKEIHNADVSNLSKLEYIRYTSKKINKDDTAVASCTTTYDMDNNLIRSSILLKRHDSKIVEKAIIYHELGHCVLRLPHTPEFFKSLMSSNLAPESFYLENWDTLVHDMCTRYKGFNLPREQVLIQPQQ